MLLVLSLQKSFPPELITFLAKMPHSSHNGEKKSSGKSHDDPGKHSKPSEETTSNVGYVSHRQALAERKKKKSRDKVSWPYSVQKLGPR